MTAALLNFRQCRVQGAQYTEQVGLELAAIVCDAELYERAHDTKAGVSDGDVELASDPDGLCYDTLHVRVLRHIALERQGGGGTRGSPRLRADLLSQRLQ